MKTYLVKSDTNYGLMVHVVNANSLEEAVQLALNYKPCGAWDYCDVIEIDTETPGVVQWA